MLRVGGVVLCGGQSSRMGRPKAWLPFGDETMLGRVVRLLGEVVSPIVVVAAPEQEVPPLPPDVVTARDQERGRGPLQGLAAGLAALAGKADAAYSSSCDVPFLRPAFVRRMIELLGESDTVEEAIGKWRESTGRSTSSRTLRETFQRGASKYPALELRSPSNYLKHAAPQGRTASFHARTASPSQLATFRRTVTSAATGMTSSRCLVVAWAW